ncbi:CorA family divalent cation transporter [Eubacterium barkeri]|uniref:Magnesium transporter n=1 Tax=Eubacterium barkeri TaxID=1528 RepID=A0A1H3GWR0_EUBBA|nr:CorA family divalent cation transporter [Eubacterium barkeri]SDY07415.1 magnesium transporter [Eubacterium barkeri]
MSVIEYLPSQGDETLEALLGETVYTHQRKRRHFCLPVGNKGYFLAFNPRGSKMSGMTERQSIYCDGNTLRYYGADKRSRAILGGLEPLGGDHDAFWVLAMFFTELTEEDVDHLEMMEEKINNLELQLLTNKGAAHSELSRIADFRKALLTRKRYYDQLGLIIDRLAEDQIGVIPEGVRRHFHALGQYLRYLLQFVVDLREFVTQVREAYQAKIDIDQNQTMKIFTVITAVFLPLSLIVGWYGMNFNIPEFGWAHGYLYVIVLSVAVCVASFIIFKRKKWF